MSWKTDVSLPMIDGVRYGGKDVEFTRFLDLPRRRARPLEIAMSGAAPVIASSRPVASREREDKSATMDAYRAYLPGGAR